MEKMKLFKVLIGCTPVGRNTEQHDVFFGIAANLQSLVPQLKAFWLEAEGKIHVDAFREVKFVSGYLVIIADREDKVESDAQLFFINLGGYIPDDFNELHYRMLVAETSKAAALKTAKETAFFRHTHFKGASSHIDDKFGVDVDDFYEIDDILAPELKSKYKVVLKKSLLRDVEDKINLGYFNLSKIESGNFESE